MSSGHWRASCGDESKGRPIGLDMESPEESNGGMIDMVLPILTLTLATVYFMIDSGAAVLADKGLPFSVLGSFENTNVGSSLVYGALCSLVVSIGLAMRLKLGASNWMKAAPQGIMAMLPAINILLFAWTIGAVVARRGDRQVPGFPGQWQPADGSAARRGLRASPVPWRLPPAPAGAPSASCCRSPATWPAASDISLMLPMLAAVLAGSVFGDHSSPISSTSILLGHRGRLPSHRSRDDPAALCAGHRLRRGARLPGDGADALRAGRFHRERALVPDLLPVTICAKPGSTAPCWPSHKRTRGPRAPWFWQGLWLACAPSIPVRNPSWLHCTTNLPP